VGCEVYFSTTASAKVVQARRHKEVRTIRIMAVGILNLDCGRIASVTGRSHREEMALVTCGVGGCVDALQDRKVCLPPGNGPLLLVLA
jgi:hypothetical protein